MHFTKLFSSILDSTIWQECAETKIVFITMLAMADRNGEIHASVPGLASRSKVTLPECEAALASFLAPDKYSRTKAFEGRRIEEMDGGWRLLNHGKYRELLSADERRAYNRQKQAEHRAKQKKGHEEVNDVSMTVNHNKQCQHSTEVEAEAEAEKRERETRVCEPAREGTPTLARAIALADTQGVTAAEAEAWWNAREASEWTKSGGGESRIKVPLDKLAQDLKAYTNAVRESNRRRAPGGYQRPPQPAPDYAGDIRRIEAKKAAQAAMEAENRAFAAANPDLDTF